MFWQRQLRRLALLLAAVAAMAAVTAGWTPAAQARPVATAPAHNDTFFINQLTNQCMEVGWSRTDQGAPVDQYPCYYGRTQLWNYSDETGVIQNVNSGLCLQYTSATDFASVVQTDCRRGVNIQWVKSVYGFITPASDESKCLEVPYSSYAPNANLGIYRCWYGKNQLWKWSS